MKSILIIDDDVELCELLEEYLSSQEFSITKCHDGADGLELALKIVPDLIVLDVMLPNMNGFEVLRGLRAESAIPVVMLTAKGEEIDRIVGLEMGADDYLPKPFNPRELLARVRAVFRRIGKPEKESTESGRIEVGDVVLDKNTQTVYKDSEQVILTSVEFQILTILLENAGKVVERPDLSEKVLGRRLSYDDRSIDVHLSNLRKKLGHKLGELERIKTVRGTGYLYVKLPD
jgi:two-component system response regulator CpxR